jgi:two-component system CheB/CheR fusion protein
MGASAGGLAAFETFFTRMSPDSGMAFVLVQHLASDHTSLLPSLLARYTQMPVQQATATLPVEPNHVYIIPPDATMTIAGGRLHVLSPSEEPRGHRTPIDQFFRSLAADQGEYAVCILLSGTGTDGTMGLRAVKEYGGMAMAQTPETAQYDSLLRSAIATGLVDHILPVEDMPARLREYAVHLTTGRREDTGNHLPTIYRLLQRQTGHDFSQYKESTIRRRLQRRMQALQLDAVGTYIERLQHDATEVDFLFKDMLIGVTHFFRDPAAFAALEQTVIPQLFADKGANAQVRVCVCGCATGEEAYSLAMLLREHMDRLTVVPRVQVFATDIDAQALEMARRGIYPEGIAEHLTPERLGRFFVKQDHTYQVKPELREMCLFTVHSFTKDPPFARLDLLSCRNVLIYLGSELQHRLLRLFHYALRADGYLFLGPSETLPGQSELFRPLGQHRIFQKTDHVVHAPVEFPLTDVRWLPPRPGDASGTSRSSAVGQLNRLERTILEHYAPACVICTAQGEAVYFGCRTGRYLEPPAGAPNVNLVNMARAGLRLPLRTALHQAVTTQQRVVQERVQVHINGGVQPVTLVVEPLPGFDDNISLYMVLFQDVGPTESPAPAEPGAAPPGSEEAYLHALEQELRATRERLSTIIEELETTNEELSSANEELQSTNEELELSKEELQSLNEELETVNAELCRKVDTLDQTNSDLQNLLDSTQIATIFLDTTLGIKNFTPAISTVLPLRSSDLGRPLGDLAPRFADVDLIGAARDVLRTLAWQERYVRTTDGNAQYLVRLGPYRTVANVINGVVITFTDVTALQQAEEAARAAQIYAESIVATIREPLLVLDATLHVRSANRAFYTVFQVTPAETEGFLLYELGNGQWNIPALRQLLEELLPQQQVLEDFEVTHDFPGIGPRTMRLNARQLFDTASNTALILLAMEDITVRRQAEAVLQQTHDELERQVEESTAALHHELAEHQRLEHEVQQAAHFAMLGRLAAGVSHEIRNPLAAVFLQVELLAEELQQPTPNSPAVLVEVLADIKVQLVRLEDLVQDYLSLVRVAHIVRAPQDLGAAVLSWAAEVQEQATASGVTIHLQGLAELGTVAFHANTLRRAVLNLLQNALDAMPQGGTLTLAGQGIATQVHMQVQDTGSGIPATLIEQIFVPLYTTKPGGTGLGLYIVQEIVAAHGGQVTVQSIEGHGSTFTITLPRTTDEASVPDGVEGANDV